VIFFQYPVTRLIDLAPKYLIMALGSLLYGVGYLGMSWVGAYGLALGAIAMVTAGEITFTPTTYAVAGELAPEKRRGHYMGFFGLSETLGMSFGPLIGGILLDVFPTHAGFIALIAVLGFLRWGRTRYKPVVTS
jgi:MFS family permease